MAGVRYDLRGRLMSFYVIPPQKEDAPPPQAATSTPPDFSPLFAEAKLDPAALTPAEPQWTPPFFCDTRAAWEGRWPARPDLRLRVEAAAHRGRPVFFRIVNPWTRAERDQPFVPTPGQRVSLALMLVILGVLLVGGGVLAKRNLRLGRGDRRGAFRIGLFVFALGMLAFLVAAHHVADPVAELASGVRWAGTALIVATTMWLFHLAIEPYVRRERPWTIVSWTRLLDGGLSDTAVGRDVLYGAVWGALVAVASGLAPRLPGLLGQAEPAPQAGYLEALLDLRSRVAFVVARPLDAALFGLAMLLLFLVLRFLLRSDVPASLALVGVLCLVHVAQSAHPLWYSIPFGLLFVGSLVWLLLRFGLVAAITGMCVSDLLAYTPQSLEIDQWVGAGTVFAVSLVVALAAFAFRIASRPAAGAPRYASPDPSGARSG
jgi:hypothetical protein